jgi:hypothetical protein
VFRIKLAAKRRHAFQNQFPEQIPQRHHAIADFEMVDKRAVMRVETNVALEEMSERAKRGRCPIRRREHRAKHAFETAALVTDNA